MARKKRKRASYRRIDLRERKAIEHGLDKGGVRGGNGYVGSWTQGDDSAS